MIQPADYNAETILSEEVFTGIFGEEDNILQARLLLSFQEKAERLDKEKPGTLKKFNSMAAASIMQTDETYKTVQEEVQENANSEDFPEDDVVAESEVVEVASGEVEENPPFEE